MCGIVGYTGTQQAAPILLEGLKKLEYRGYDSAGIAVMNGGSINVSKVSGRISLLCEKTRDGSLTPGSTGIGHTRWATHGAPTDSNAHPHASGTGIFAVVHNGIIENYAQLKEELTSKGYSFHSQTDTEVVAQLLDMYYTGDIKTAVMKTAARLKGSYALGIICADAPDKIFLAREASPLIIGLGAGENFFASDVTALVSHTRSVIYLSDGEFAEIEPGSFQIYDCAGRPVQKNAERINWDIQAAERGGYEHFMLKEIMEQPGAFRATVAPRLRDGEIVLDDLKLSDERLRAFNKVVITACGSAYYAGCAGRYAIEKLCRLPVQTELASELRYSESMTDENTLVIVLSQSGETADTIAAMKECSRRGAYVLAVVNVVGSTIAKLADCVLYTWAGPEIAVATTKGYTTQLALLYLIALRLGVRRGTVSREEYLRLTDRLSSLPGRMQQAIDMGSAIPRLAKKYHDNTSMFFIGRGTDYAAALEGALKMKEISYIHAECYAAGELKHGTIALIQEGRPVIALCCSEAVAEKTMNNIIEVKTRGAEVLAIACAGNREISSVADDVIYIPAEEAVFSAALEVLPLQLLAYYVAKENGCDIDKPRNLAKSVTVE